MKLKIEATCLIGFLFHERCVDSYAKSELSPSRAERVTLFVSGNDPAI